MTDNPVEAHYTSQSLGEAILAALKAAGKDLDHLTPDDLAPVDEFHGGQRPATIRLAELVGFTGSERVLDVGSGLGGPSRYLAWRYGCRVSGVDLTTEFVRVAEMLTRLTGLVDKVDYRQGSALDLPFEDAELRCRVVAERGDEHCRPRPPLPRDAPGAETGRQARAAGGRRRSGRPAALSGAVGTGSRVSAFSIRRARPAAKLEAAGFRVLVWQDTTAAGIGSRQRRGQAAASAHRRRLGTHLILGDDWQAMFHNSARNLEERRTELFNAVLERVG